jgi:hypothetical protein
VPLHRDYGSEFIPQIALIPRRPWLMPSLPIILPPIGIGISRAGSDVNISRSDNRPDRIDMAESDMDEDIILPVSDENDIPDHIDIPDSDDNLDMHFPVSDSEQSDAMDVVRSDEVEIHDSGSDILFPESPITTRTMSGSGAVAGIERDPDTGRFTAASFANFPDEMLD